MIYGYARVSTKGQERNGNSIQDQVNRLTEAGCVKVFEDKCTGTKMDRPEFNELMNVIQPGDTLVVTKLDRFARTASGGAAMIHELVSRGVTVNVLNMGVADNTPMGKLMVQIMFAFAEFERDMIVERTSAGKEVAKSNNPDWREGRKTIDLPDLSHYISLHRAGKLTVPECCEALGISRATWYNRVRQLANG